jgi:hypothetical protein
MTDWLPQFMCVKAVIFFSYWQGVALLCLEKLDILGPAWGWTEAQVPAPLAIA